MRKGKILEKKNIRRQIRMKLESVYKRIILFSIQNFKLLDL